MWPGWESALDLSVPMGITKSKSGDNEDDEVVAKRVGASFQQTTEAFLSLS